MFKLIKLTKYIFWFIDSFHNCIPTLSKINRIEGSQMNRQFKVFSFLKDPICVTRVATVTTRI